MSRPSVSAHALLSNKAYLKKTVFKTMPINEKYPQEVPWDSTSNLDKSLRLKWMLTKSENVYIFSRSRLNDKYVYIQRNNGKKKAYKDYAARFTYQRLFDEGYLLAAVA